MTPSFKDFEEMEKKRLIESINEQMTRMDLHDLEVLDKVSKNVNVIISLLQSLKRVSSWG